MSIPIVSPRTFSTVAPKSSRVKMPAMMGTIVWGIPIMESITEHMITPPPGTPEPPTAIAAPSTMMKMSWPAERSMP